uniref:helix-turn-helix transcriptional regulator n=1 Tax=Paractinoplanes polyasparticus TaxID=2856853 RepID=UPI001C864E6C|nr:response regulator transcription factor [Actinoplanes polyasparticus]
MAVEQVRVAVQGADALSQAGLVSFLQQRPEFVVVPGNRPDQAQVFVVGTGRLTVDVVAMLRRSAREVGVPVILVVDGIDESELLVAVECRVVAILPRLAVTADRLHHAIRAAAEGGAVMSPSLVGSLLNHIQRLHKNVLAVNGLDASGLNVREIEVLRLMADGFDTVEIAGKLSVSERTVKNIVYGMTHRLDLRNRSHAVAYALRAGII